MLNVMPLLLLLVLLLWVGGVGAIAGLLMGRTYSEWQDRPHQGVHQTWPFMVSASIAGLAGCVTGLLRGYEQPVDNCGLSMLACGLDAIFNALGGGIIGTLVGATLGAVGLATVIWLIQLIRQR